MEERGVYEAEVLSQDRPQGCGHLSPLEIPEMLHRPLQDFRLLQFRVSVAIFFECIQDESFQLAQALVHSGSSPLLLNWLGQVSVCVFL